MFFLVRLPTEPLAFRHIRYCGRKRNERVEKMKKNGFRAVLAALFLVLLSTSVWAAEMLVPVGRAVGLELEAAGLAVAELDAQLGAHARDAGLEVGDIIIKADGQAVPNAAALQEAVDRSKGGLVLTVLRNGEEMNVTVTPVEHEGRRRLGIYVREGIAGVGTVTYYDPETGAFGALGHGVSDAHGNLLPLQAGSAMEAEIISVKKGRAGTPGQLQGSFQKDAVLGELEKNTRCGIFGVASAGWAGIPLPVAEVSQIHTGPATILSNVTGTEVQEYSVEILKLYPGEKACGRNLLLHVTDAALLEATGGIVQGMSGSPIIQDGKFIGAVTHVLVNDPTTGYGIFLETMLGAA